MFVPRSRQIGIVDSGRILWALHQKTRSPRVVVLTYPAPATYSDSLPIEMPMPLTPRSPRPRMRDPGINASKHDGATLQIIFYRR